MEAPRQITIRGFTMEDAEEVRAILAQSPQAAQWIDAPAALLAFVDGQLAAFLSYRVVLEEGEILNIAVAPAFRRMGVASQMLRSVFDLAPVWFLEVRVSNEAAQSTYRSLGFREIGRRARYYADGEDALLFCWP
jgi:ribosomal-protein-alanine N-acetyltransferase